MKHIISDIADVPPVPPVFDRRRNPDRRTEWRGGRRDSDWVNRPPDALAKLESRQSRAAAFKRAVFSVMHLW
jgi:hypothetical protein